MLSNEQCERNVLNRNKDFELHSSVGAEVCMLDTRHLSLLCYNVTTQIIDLVA